MEALATETATAYRLLDALSNDDNSLAERLDTPLDGVSSMEVRRDMHCRIDALKALAVHRRAHSTKGALFQLYILAERFYTIPGNTSDTQNGWAAHQLQLIYSAIAVIEGGAEDADTKVLRKQLLPDVLDVCAVSDVLLAQHGQAPG